MRLATGLAEDNSAHRVPQRNNAGNPKPIVCRFVRRLVKESLMSHRKEISNVTPAAVGLPEGSSLSSARIYDHLSPRMQAVLFQAKKVKEELHYQYCCIRLKYLNVRPFVKK